MPAAFTRAERYGFTHFNDDYVGARGLLTLDLRRSWTWACTLRNGACHFVANHVHAQNSFDCINGLLLFIPNDCNTFSLQFKTLITVVMHVVMHACIFEGFDHIDSGRFF